MTATSLRRSLIVYNRDTVWSWLIYSRKNRPGKKGWYACTKREIWFLCTDGLHLIWSFLAQSVYHVRIAVTCRVLITLRVQDHIPGVPELHFSVSLCQKWKLTIKTSSCKHGMNCEVKLYIHTNDIVRGRCTAVWLQCFCFGSTNLLFNDQWKIFRWHCTSELCGILWR